LNEQGLAGLTKKLGAIPLQELRLYMKGSGAQLKLPNAEALSRESLDAALISKAIEAGAHFLPEHTATVEKANLGRRNVMVKNVHTHRSIVIQTRLVIVADGIAGQALDQLDGFAPIILRQSRIGAGAIVDHAPQFYEPGKIFMANGKGGYVGIVRLEDNRLDVACAFDLSYSRASGGPAAAASCILDEVGLPAIKELSLASWQGTAPLSRRRRFIASEHLFVIGDAASYAEPFTGEGIAWALLSANAVSPLAKVAIVQWSNSLALAWTKEHASLIGKRQSLSRQIARLLRTTTLSKMATHLLSKMPFLATPMVRYISAPVRSVRSHTLNY
jgi:flavin-dependent dehydrogenase